MLTTVCSKCCHDMQHMQLGSRWCALRHGKKFGSSPGALLIPGDHRVCRRVADQVEAARAGRDTCQQLVIGHSLGHRKLLHSSRRGAHQHHDTTRHMRSIASRTVTLYAQHGRCNGHVLLRNGGGCSSL
jgi:hypothetical protein